MSSQLIKKWDDQTKGISSDESEFLPVIRKRINLINTKVATNEMSIFEKTIFWFS